MSQLGKLLEDLRAYKTGSVAFDDLLVLSPRFGILVENNGGSGYTFSHDLAAQVVTIHRPHGRRERLSVSDLKRFEALIDEVLEKSATNEPG